MDALLHSLDLFTSPCPYMIGAYEICNNLINKSLCIVYWIVYVLVKFALHYGMLQHWSSVVEPRKHILQCRGHTISQNQLRFDMYYILNTSNHNVYLIH